MILQKIETPKCSETFKNDVFGPPQAENFWGLEGLIRIPPLIRYKILLRGGYSYRAFWGEENFEILDSRNDWKPFTDGLKNHI